MITAVAGGGVVTPVIGFAIGTVGVIGGVFCYFSLCVLFDLLCFWGEDRGKRSIIAEKMLSSPESYLATAELSTSKMLYVLRYILQ